MDDTVPLPEPDMKASKGVCCGNYTTGGSYMGQSEELCCGNFDEAWPDYYTADQMHAHAAAVSAADNAALRERVKVLEDALADLLSLYDQRIPLRERPTTWEAARAALGDKNG